LVEAAVDPSLLVPNARTKGRGGALYLAFGALPAIDLRGLAWATRTEAVMMQATWGDELDRHGYTLLRDVFSGPEVESLAEELSEALSAAVDEPGAIRSYGGCVYAARNVLALHPPAIGIWQRGPLIEVLTEALGAEFSLVRGLYFDKPPERSWSLPWHKDLTIAVAQNDLPTAHFHHPTRKAGVAHVEAPRWLLESMLTLRIHLDPVSDENGPLRVIAGSHRGDDAAPEDDGPMQAIHCQRGDVLAMRPLVSHASGNSWPGTTRHRRVLHLEFARDRELPDGYQWHEFHRPTQEVLCRPLML
jgi:hypothetical protein